MPTVMTTLTIYSTPNCIQCEMTYRMLERAGINYQIVNLPDKSNEASRKWVTEDLGYTQAPVVVVGTNDHWSGFRPDQIKRITKA